MGKKKGGGGVLGGLATSGSPIGWANSAFNGDMFGGLANLRNDIFGINDQAKYAQRAAEAEQRQRQAVTAEARAGAARLNLAAQSPQQLAALERSYQAAQTQVDADLRQLAAIDPAIMEASKQVLSLLQGKQAAVNDPLVQQRSAQRDQLVNSLRSQYGPGAESSSIGQRALQQFDMQTNSMYQQNQQQSLGQLMGIATTKTGGVGFGQLLNTAAGYGDYQSRIANAEGLGTRGILDAMSGEVQSAGAQYTADLLKSGARRQWYTMMEDDGRQIGRTWATMGTGGGGGKGGGGGGNFNNAGQAYNTGYSGQFRQGNLAADSNSYNPGGQSGYNPDWMTA